MSKAWTRWWFDPVPVTNLAVCRILFFGAMFLYYAGRDFTVWSDVSNVFWHPIFLFYRLHLTPLSAEHLRILQFVWRTALVLSCIGLFTRVATAVSFLLGIYILGLPHNFGTEYHYDTIIVLIFATMALSRCGDGWSVDRLLQTARSSVPSTVPPHGEYRWPVQVVQLVMAFVFFAAGVAKFRHSGLNWALSSNMSTMLIEHQYHIANADPLTSWGLVIAHYTWVASLLAAGTMFAETLYPLALFSRRARMVLVPAVFLMQVGIRTLMGPTFDQYLICNLFWVPWDQVPVRMRRMLPGGSRYAVGYEFAAEGAAASGQQNVGPTASHAEHHV